MGGARAHPKVLSCFMPRTATVCGLAALAGLAVAAWLWASRHEFRFSAFHDSAPVERLWRARYVRRALAGWFLSSMRGETAESAPDGVSCASEPVGLNAGGAGGPVSVADLRAFYKDRQPPKVCVVSLSVGRKDPSMILTQSVGTGMHFSRLPADPESYWARGVASPPPQICSSRAWDASTASAAPLAHWIVLDVDSRPHPEAAALSDVVTVVKAGGVLSDPLATAALDRRQQEFWKCSAAYATWQAAADAIAGNSTSRTRIEAKLAASAAAAATSSNRPGGSGGPASDRAAAAEPVGGSLRSGKSLGRESAEGDEALLLRWGQLMSFPPLGPGAPVGPLPSPPAACTPFAAFALRRDVNAHGHRLSRRSPWRQWPRLHSRHAKATLDYALALDVCSNAVGAELAVVLEDDAVMTRGWLNKLLLTVVPRTAELAADDEVAHPEGSEDGPAAALLSLPTADSEPWKFHFREGPAFATPLLDKPSLAARVAAAADAGYDTTGPQDGMSGPSPQPHREAVGSGEGPEWLFTPLEGSGDDAVLRQDPAAAAVAAAGRRADAFQKDVSTALQRRVTWVKLFYPDFLEQWGEGDIVAMVAGPTAVGVVVLLLSGWVLGLVEGGHSCCSPADVSARPGSGGSSGSSGCGGTSCCAGMCCSSCRPCGLSPCSLCLPPCCWVRCSSRSSSSGGPRHGERSGSAPRAAGSHAAASQLVSADGLVKLPSTARQRPVPDSACTLEARCAGLPPPQRRAGGRALARRAAALDHANAHTVLSAVCIELRCSCGLCATRQRRESHGDSDSVGSEGSPPGETADFEAGIGGASITRRAMGAPSGPEVSPLNALQSDTSQPSSPTRRGARAGERLAPLSLAERPSGCAEPIKAAAQSSVAADARFPTAAGSAAALDLPSRLPPGQICAVRCPRQVDRPAAAVSACVLSGVILTAALMGAGRAAITRYPWQEPGVQPIASGCCIVATLFPRQSARQLSFELRTYWASEADFSDFSLPFAAEAHHPGKLRLIAVPHLAQHIGFVSTQPGMPSAVDGAPANGTSSSPIATPAELPRAEAPIALPQGGSVDAEPSPVPPSPGPLMSNGDNPPDPPQFQTDMATAPPGHASWARVHSWAWTRMDTAPWARRFYGGDFGYSAWFDQPVCGEIELGGGPDGCPAE